MLKRAHWLGAALAVSVVPFAAWPFVGGCQTTCSPSTDCGSSSYCSFSTGLCASPSAVGFCQSLPDPDSCSKNASDPVCGCDGKEYLNQYCAALAHVSVLNAGSCTPVACEVTSALPCKAAGTYCHIADGQCKNAYATGTCEPTGTGNAGTGGGGTGGGGTSNPACANPTPETVCGCNGKTYANRCAAAMEEANVLATGPCPCGGSSGPTCSTPGQFCQFAMGTCSMPNPAGTCIDPPTATQCSTSPNPVCGCDKKTYTNACMAAANKASIASMGPCPCEGPGGVPCASTEYCSYTTVGACLQPGLSGVCVPRPTTCAPIMDTVCGCDGNKYDNPCLAAKNGGTDITGLTTGCM
jgi:hypothetical protein